MSSYCERIIALIHEIRPYEEVMEDTELIKSGIVDSLSLVNLIVLLEEHFGIEINDEEVVAENFSSIAAIEHLVIRVAIHNE